MLGNQNFMVPPIATGKGPFNAQSFRSPAKNKEEAKARFPRD